ncbi:MAG: ABC transporter ATP-binding protein, partial [bacterium]
MTSALEFHGVVKRYGRTRALDGLDLSVPRGSIFGMVGSNGAGKTTAMALATGLLQSDAGTINLLGDGSFNAERHAGRVTLLPQDSRFPPHARVEELLRYYGCLQGAGGKELESSINTLLDWVHLSDRRKSAVKTLSHGMTRRLAIAQAFLGHPELVLLDEPLNGLDPLEATRVRTLLRERRGHQAIIVSSHHLADLEAICDTVAFIEKGKLVRQDSLAAIIQSWHRITYLLTHPGPPRDTLAVLTPGVEWQTAVDGKELTAIFSQDYSPETLNAKVIPLLLASECGILEIKRGSDLETEYLR